MADSEREDQWGHTIAKWTFVLTVIGAVLFIGAVVLFVLSRKV